MMRSRGLACFVLLVSIGLCMYSVMLAYADVPSVLELTIKEEGADTVLVIEVRHNSPTISHYVDEIEVEIDGNVEKITDLEPQTSTSFEEEYVLDAGEKNIRVRAHCNLHGWSSWVIEEEETQGGGGIPGFPYESIALGLVVGIFLIWMLQRKY